MLRHALAMLLAALSLMPIVARAAPTFTIIPGARNPVGISNDGKTMAGWYGSYSGWIWTEAEGLRSVANLPGMPGDNQVTAISRDGKVIGGHTRIGVSGPGAWIWSLEGGYRSLGVFPGGPGLAPDWGTLDVLSYDGSVAYGTADSPNGYWDHPEFYRWTAATGLVSLGVPNPIFKHEAVSDDGQVVVRHIRFGFGGSQESGVWTQATGYVSLGHLPGASVTGATDMTSDGSMIVGSSGDGGTNPRPFRWTRTGGLVEITPSVDFFHPRHTSDDGNVILGSLAVEGSPLVIWDAQQGVRDLTQLVTSLGIDLQGRTLFDTSAFHMSPDARFIVANIGKPAGNGDYTEVETFLLDFGAPVPEPATIVLGLFSVFGGAMAFRHQRRVVRRAV